MKDPLIILAVVTLIILSVIYEIALWKECRQTNSFLYCTRVLSK